MILSVVDYFALRLVGDIRKTGEKNAYRGFLFYSEFYDRIILIGYQSPIRIRRSAASKSYYARQNYWFLSDERNSAVGSDSLFELNESDVWNVSVSPESRKTVTGSRIHQRSSSVAVLGSVRDLHRWQ
ncbi:hypothetical protein LXL04_031875 [Taraxacum kok-saghyz]